jgi:hypothetical protein
VTLTTALPNSSFTGPVFQDHGTPAMSAQLTDEELRASAERTEIKAWPEVGQIKQLSARMMERERRASSPSVWRYFSASYPSCKLFPGDPLA